MTLESARALVGEEEDEERAEEEKAPVAQLTPPAREGAQFRINVNDLALLRGLGIEGRESAAAGAPSDSAAAVGSSSPIGSGVATAGGGTAGDSIAGAA